VTSTPEAERNALFASSPEAAPPSPEAEGEGETRFIGAIQDGLRQAMEDDEDVIVMGQDVAEYGGVFKVTDGFVDTFGRERVRNTPIIESGAIGAGLGLAVEGLTPVVEMQYADFITCGFNQTVNNLATTHYRWGQPVNVTIRAPFGGGIGAGPFHSQSMEAWFAHVPGLKVAVPATPRDAKGLLRTAIEEPNPVLFLEHKKLYRSVRGPVPNASYSLPLGEARVAREGVDATIATYGVGVHWALAEARHQAKANGVALEVVDLRTLVPWDRETVRRSLDKTNRLLVLHEATRTAGFGAELAAELGEVGFELLDAPITRVAAKDLPVPNAKPLEDEIFSAEARLRPKLEALLEF
jgi:2-oxoisovalerate dehydrogenase E1 component